MRRWLSESGVFTSLFLIAIAVSERNFYKNEWSQAVNLQFCNSMTNPYLTSHSLYSEFQKAYESVMSGSGLVFKAYPQPNCLVFGLRIDQAIPSNYLNTFIPYGENIYNSFGNFRLKKVPVRVIASTEFGQSEPLYLPHRPKAHQQADQNTKIPASQSELRIERFWSMAGETSSHSSSINVNPPPLTSTLKNTAGSSLSDFKFSVSGPGESLTVSHDKPYRKAYAQQGKGSVAKQARAESRKERPCTQAEKRKAYEQAEKRKAYCKAWSHSERGKAMKRTWAQSEKGKAYQKAYAQSEKRKAYLKAYSQSERGKASKRAYAQSEKGKATYRARQQSLKMKALQSASHEAFKHTSDQEQEKITGKQATVLSAQTSEATDYK